MCMKKDMTSPKGKLCLSETIVEKRLLFLSADYAHFVKLISKILKWNI